MLEVGEKKVSQEPESTKLGLKGKLATLDIREKYVYFNSLLSYTAINKLIVEWQSRNSWTTRR